MYLAIGAGSIPVSFLINDDAVPFTFCLYHMYSISTCTPSNLVILF